MLWPQLWSFRLQVAMRGDLRLQFGWTTLHVESASGFRDSCGVRTSFSKMQKASGTVATKGHVLTQCYSAGDLPLRTLSRGC